MKCGGVGEASPADADIQKICDKVRGEHETKAGQTFDEYKAHSYASQVVAGTNYYVKVDVGGELYHHVRIYQPLPHTGQGPELTAHQADKTLDDKLEYFQ